MPNQRKKPHVDRQAPSEPAAPIDEASAADESGFPRRNTEQDRERRPGTRTREEIRKNSVPGKTH